MNSQEPLLIVDSLVPLICGASLGLLAIAGMRELIKEAFAALKKEARA